MPSLRITLPDNRGETVHILTDERVTVGRRPDNTIQIVDRTVSGHHAEFIAKEGRYRLHDLGSTNLTFVAGRPIMDYHLNEGCKVRFGSVECEFFIEDITATHAVNAKAAPGASPAEIEALRRENTEMRAKLSELQKQNDILGSARLLTKESSVTAQLGISPEVHRRLVVERDALKRDLERAHADLTSIERERDAMRQAWETARAELAAAKNTLSSNGLASVAVELPAPTPAPEAAPAVEAAPAKKEDHRALAMIITKAPALMKDARKHLERLVADSSDLGARENAAKTVSQLTELLDCVKGHPVHRLTASTEKLLRDFVSRSPGKGDSRTIATALQAMEAAAQGLNPKSFTKARSAAVPQILIVENDSEQASALLDGLRQTGLNVKEAKNADDARQLLEREAFDSVLFDIALPGINGLEFCKEIRAQSINAKTSLIACSINNGPESIEAAKAAGADDFAHKPYFVPELTTRVEGWLSRRCFAC